MSASIVGLPPGTTLKPISPAPQQAIAGLPPGAIVKPISAEASPSGGQPSANGGPASAAPPNPNQWATNIVPGNQTWNPKAASQQAAQDWTSWSTSQRQKDLQSGKPSFGINLPFGMRLDKAALEGTVGGAEQAAANLWTPKNAALTAGAVLPGTNVPVLLYLVGRGTQLATAPREINEDHSDYVGRVVNGVAMAVGAGAGLAEVAPETAALPGKIKAYQAARAQASATAIKGINRVVDAGGTEARSVILHATEKAYESQASEKFQAINAKDEADIAAKGNIPQINIQPASEAVNAAKDVYGQTFESNPASARKLTALNNTPPRLTFEQAKQLRSSLYDARLEASNPNQSAILTAGYNTLGKLLQERANNLGMQNEYLDATENTGVIKGSEPGESLGRIIQKLQGAETGSDFWNIINTQADGPDLERLQTSLEQAGTLPKGFLDNIQDHYAKAQALLKSVGKNGNFMGILRSVMQHPARSIPTYMAGHAAGGFIGGYIALGWMNDLAQQLDIESELNRLGSKPAESLFKNRGATPPIKGGATIGERLAAQNQTPSKAATSAQNPAPSGGRAAPSDLLYHATDVSRVPKIQAEGLRPGTWFANSPEEAMRSGAVPISGNRADLRVFSVPRAEITPGTPDSADMGAGNSKFTYSANTHPSPTLLPSENAITFTKDSNGITWAANPSISRNPVSIPDSIPETDRQAYAEEKLKQQDAMDLKLHPNRKLTPNAAKEGDIAQKSDEVGKFVGHQTAGDTVRLARESVESPEDKAEREELSNARNRAYIRKRIANAKAQVLRIKSQFADGFISREIAEKDLDIYHEQMRPFVEEMGGELNDKFFELPEPKD